MGEYEKAFLFIDECKTICRSIDYPQALAGVLGQHGLILGRMGKHNQALDLFLENWASMSSSRRQNNLSSILSPSVYL